MDLIKTPLSTTPPSETNLTKSSTVPDAATRKVCDELKLPFPDTAGIVVLSGLSGFLISDKNCTTFFVLSVSKIKVIKSCFDLVIHINRY